MISQWQSQKQSPDQKQSSLVFFLPLFFSLPKFHVRIYTQLKRSRMRGGGRRCGEALLFTNSFSHHIYPWQGSDLNFWVQSDFLAFRMLVSGVSTSKVEKVSVPIWHRADFLSRFTHEQPSYWSSPPCHPCLFSLLLA